MNLIIAWFRRYLSDPQVIFLILSLLLFFSGIMALGSILAPVLASVVMAYLLDGVVQFMERRQVPHLMAVILVFFMLKDKYRIIAWFRQYIPDNHGLTAQVWHDVDYQVANYVRGKFLEIILVWIVSFIVFTAIGLDYAVLLGAVVGFLVLVPYIGGAVAVIPIGIVALFQFGWSMPTLYALAAYGIIHFIDGNILVPVMFAGVLDLHPIAIIVAILFFGGIWGMWGVFFAILLATLVRAVLEAWPRQRADVEVPPL